MADMGCAIQQIKADVDVQVIYFSRLNGRWPKAKIE